MTTIKSLKLSNRLAAIAAFIGDAAGVADVGTDHGYLPVWLALHRGARRIVATDIRRGPLDSAVRSAAEYGAAGIEFVLTDGLAGIDGAGIDAVVIAGMGGETIIQILQNALWTRAARVKLILQPQTKADELTGWLRENGYGLSDAALAEDEGRVYLIFTAGTGSDGAFRDPMDMLLTKRDPLLPLYLARLANKTRRALTGLTQGADPDPGAVDALRRSLEAYEKIKEETDTWQR